MLFEVPLVDILPLIKCKPEAEAIVHLKMHLLKLGHLLDACNAETLHRQTLSSMRDMAVKASIIKALPAVEASSTLQTSTARLATLHCILHDTLTTTTPAEDNAVLKENILKALESLFHVERSLHQYALQNKSLSQELNFSGFDQLAKDKLKLYSVENALCDKLRGVLSLAMKRDFIGDSNTKTGGAAGLRALLKRSVPHTTSASSHPSNNSSIPSISLNAQCPHKKARRLPSSPILSKSLQQQRNIEQSDLALTSTLNSAAPFNVLGEDNMTSSGHPLLRTAAPFTPKLRGSQGSDRDCSPSATATSGSTETEGNASQTHTQCRRDLKQSQHSQHDHHILSQRVLEGQYSGGASQSNSFNSTPSPEIKINSSYKICQSRDDSCVRALDTSKSSLNNGRTSTV